MKSMHSNLLPVNSRISMQFTFEWLNRFPSPEFSSNVSQNFFSISTDSTISNPASENPMSKPPAPEKRLKVLILRLGFLSKNLRNPLPKSSGHPGSPCLQPSNAHITSMEFFESAPTGCCVAPSVIVISFMSPPVLSALAVLSVHAAALLELLSAPARAGIVAPGFLE